MKKDHTTTVLIVLLILAVFFALYGQLSQTARLEVNGTVLLNYEERGLFWNQWHSIIQDSVGACWDVKMKLPAGTKVRKHNEQM